MTVVQLDVTQLAIDLNAAGQMAERSLGDLMLQVANAMAAEMRQRAPVDTGNLRDSIGVTVTAPGRIEVGPNIAQAPYAWMVELGTQPHVIEAKPGKTLRFVKEGKVIYTKRVNHPGTKPKPYIRPTVQHWMDLLSTDAGRVAAQQILSPQ